MKTRLCPKEDGDNADKDSSASNVAGRESAACASSPHFKIKILSRCELFAGLSATELEQMAALWQRRSLPSHRPLLQMGQVSDAVYLVTSGRLKVFTEQADGSCITLRILGVGEVLGEINALDGKGHSASVVTLEAAGLLWMERHAFRECVGAYPIVGLNLSVLLCRRLRLATTQIQTLSCLDVTGRVARQILALWDTQLWDTQLRDVRLLDCRDAQGASVNKCLHLRQNDLAEMVGASRAQVNRALGTLQRLGAISHNRQSRIAVLDRARLAAYEI